MTLIYVPLLRPLFWIVMGLNYLVVLASANSWIEDVGIAMTWWKWLLAILWYGFLNFCFAGGFTLIGEKEPRAGFYFLGFSLLLTIILGLGLWGLIWFY
jgi:hypothetical protein